MLHPRRRPASWSIPGAVATSLVIVTALAFPAPGLAQDEGPLTLTLAVANAHGEPTQPSIDTFVEQVSTLSGGSMAIDPLYDAGNATEEGFEQGVAVLVERGDADLGLNASRTWDLTGATSLQALQAPFLISDGNLAAAVAEGDIAERALAGLGDVGVVGLALWPEDLRHPFALGDHAPFLSPADFDGATILVQPSALSRAMISGLGAELYVDGNRDADAAAGRLDGAESGLLQGHTLPGHPTATGDVTFYPKFEVLSANADAFSSLTPEQQGILRDAAAETRRLAIENHTSEADAAAAWCGAGGTVVLAGADGVAAFEAAAAPVFASISEDQLTSELIADIETLKSTTEPAPGATACAPIPTAAASPVATAMELDTDRPGLDIDDFDLPTADPALCDAACRSNPDCKAWTYVKPDTIQGPEARCWLKDAIPDAVPNPCCVSGINPVEPSEESAAASPPTTQVLDLVAAWDPSTVEGLDGPTGMDMGPSGQLYLVNAGASEILVLDSAGQVLQRWGESGSGDGQLLFLRDPNDPGSAIGGVAVTDDGAVYVADAANRRVQQFDADGGFVRTWGSYALGHEPGTFIDPIDVADGPDGTIYVVDDQRDDIQHFGSDGTWIETVGEHGTGDGQLNFTGGIYVDTAGDLLNADWDNDRVQAWGPDGSFLWSLGSHGDGPGEFRLPGDVGVDEQGNLYVADRHRVQIFGPDRAYIGDWTAPGTTPDEIYGIAVSPDGLVYVGSPWSDRIYVLREQG